MRPALILFILSSLLHSSQTTNLAVQDHKATIRYSPYSVKKICTKDFTANATRADGGLFTFNFDDGDNYKVFQVPRCIFDTEIAKEVFSSVDLTENIESYRRRFRDFYIVPIHASFRLILQSNHGKYYNSGLSPPPRSSATMKDFLIDMTKVHQIPKDKFCAITDHPTLFTARFLCSHHIITWMEYTVTISLTSKFFILTVGRNPHPSEETLAMFFGDMHQIDLKAPYSVNAFLFRQTEAHDLLTIVGETTMNTYFSFLDDANFLYGILSSDYTDLTTCIHILSTSVGTIIRNNHCGLITRETVEMFFIYGLCMFIGNSVVYTPEEPISTAAWRQSELELVGEFITRCFKTSTNNPTPLFQSRMHVKSSSESKAQMVSMLSSGMHAATLADLTYLIRSMTAPPITNQDVLFERLRFSIDAYYRKTMTVPLQTSMRRVLIRVDAAIRTQLNESEPARLLYVLLTAMCSPRELLLWSEAIFVPERGGPSHIFSPCLSGGRRDYTITTVKTLLETARRPEHRADTIMSITKIFRPSRKEISDESNCIPDTVSTTTITSKEKTYVISSENLLQGIIYPISNTVVGKNLLVTVLNRKQPCILSKTHKKKASVIVVNNVTFTEQCEFCGSTLIEYDEADGLTNVIHIPTITDLKFITDPKNRILVYTPRIHYLLLTKNGTVLEVTDILVSVRKTPYGIIIISIIAGSLALVGFYKICRVK